MIRKIAALALPETAAAMKIFTDMGEAVSPAFAAAGSDPLSRVIAPECDRLFGKDHR